MLLKFCILVNSGRNIVSLKFCILVNSGQQRFTPQTGTDQLESDIGSMHAECLPAVTWLGYILHMSTNCSGLERSNNAQLFDKRCAQHKTPQTGTDQLESDIGSMQSAYQQSHDWATYCTCLPIVVVSNSPKMHSYSIINVHSQIQHKNIYCMHTGNDITSM